MNIFPGRFKRLLHNGLIFLYDNLQRCSCSIRYIFNRSTLFSRWNAFSSALPARARTHGFSLLSQLGFSSQLGRAVCRTHKCTQTPEYRTQGGRERKKGTLLRAMHDRQVPFQTSIGFTRTYCDRICHDKTYTP